MRKYYEFAGVGLALQLPDGEEFSEGRELPAFACEPRDGMIECRVGFADSITVPDISPCAVLPNMIEYDCGGTILRYYGPMSQGAQNAGSVAEYRENSIKITIVRTTYNRITAFSLLEAIGAERLVTRAGGAILHSSFIDVGGRGILFTAPSGTGKSTQADLWREYRGATVVNGDKSVLRVVDGIPSASGLPYSGSSGICLNRTLPLAAIVYLEQAENNTVTRLRGFEAFRRVWEGVCVNTWNAEMTGAASDTVGTMLSSVPVYKLCCTPDIRAVEALEKSIFFV